MKKNQLENLASIDEFNSESPVMDFIHSNDSGFDFDSGIDISGLVDESGVLYDVRGGCEYYFVEVYSSNPDYYHQVAFRVRFVIIWTSGNITLPPAIRIHAAFDDGSLHNPFASGDMGNPVDYWDYEHYQHVRSYMDGEILEWDGKDLTIKGGYNITYKYYPAGRGTHYEVLNTQAPFEFKIPLSYFSETFEENNL